MELTWLNVGKRPPWPVGCRSRRSQVAEAIDVLELCSSLQRATLSLCSIHVPSLDRQRADQSPIVRLSSGTFSYRDTHDSLERIVRWWCAQLRHSYVMSHYIRWDGPVGSVRLQLLVSRTLIRWQALNRRHKATMPACLSSQALVLAVRHQRHGVGQGPDTDLRPA